MVNRHHLWLTSFFLLFFAAGCYCLQYIGISWDEPAMREYGWVLYDYITGESKELLGHHERFHGPIFELALVAIERLLGQTSTLEIYSLRHLLTFAACTFGLFFFYLLGVRLLKNRWLALLAIVLLATSPRIFSNMLYNSKDTVFMMLFITSIWSLHKATENRRTSWFAIHAVLVALAITVRILGMLLPAISIMVIALAPFALAKRIRIAIVYSVVVAGCVIAFWPVLWPNPPMQWIAAFEFMSQFPWDDFSLFEGQFLVPKEMPWYYLPKWIIMTTPLLQVLLCIAGPFAWLVWKRNDIYKWVVLIWALAPLVAIIGLGATVYDTWRHVYFIYPAWIIMGVELVGSAYKKINSPILLKVGMGVVIIAFGANLIWSITNYRNLHCYFNPMFRSNAALNYDYDFWGLSYLEALEWVTDQKPDGPIKLSVANAPGFYNHQMLPESDQQRIEFVSRDSADYFLSNFRFPVHFEPYQKGEFPYQNLVFEVIVDGNRALGVYQPND